jgi:hypothetical protein
MSYKQMNSITLHIINSTLTASLKIGDGPTMWIGKSNLAGEVVTGYVSGQSHNWLQTKTPSDYKISETNTSMTQKDIDISWPIQGLSSGMYIVYKQITEEGDLFITPLVIAEPEEDDTSPRMELYTRTFFLHEEDKDE